MRTRAVPVPAIPRDHEIDTTVDDSLEPCREPVDESCREPTLIGVPILVRSQVTQDLEITLRPPAESRFLIRAGFDAGAPTDIIADSIANGDAWVTGPEWAARNYIVSVTLSEPAVPVERRFMAWRPVPPPTKANT